MMAMDASQLSHMNRHSQTKTIITSIEFCRQLQDTSGKLLLPLTRHFWFQSVNWRGLISFTDIWALFSGSGGLQLGA